MNTPRGLAASLSGLNNFSLTIGDHDFSDLPILQTGPIVECLTPGSEKPAYVAWIPVFFEGEINDPNHLIRIVHEGEAEALDVPVVTPPPNRRLAVDGHGEIQGEPAPEGW